VRQEGFVPKGRFMKGLKFIVTSNNHCKHFQHIENNVNGNLQMNNLQTQKGHDQIYEHNSNNHCKHFQHIENNVNGNLQMNNLQIQKGHDQIYEHK